MKPLSKTAILKAERAARKEAKAAQKLDESLRLAAARAAADELTKRMPPDYASWGVVRTRAYVSLMEIVQAKAHNVTMTASRLEGLIGQLRRASEWTLGYCQHLTTLHARAADITEPTPS